jgi:plasmid replication initiation protein
VCLIYSFLFFVFSSFRFFFPFVFFLVEKFSPFQPNKRPKKNKFPLLFFYFFISLFKGLRFIDYQVVTSRKDSFYKRKDSFYKRKDSFYKRKDSFYKRKDILKKYIAFTLSFFVLLQRILIFQFMELIETNVEDKRIMLHNSITSGRFDVSACQLDILFMLLSMLEKNDPVEKEYLISALDIEFITNKSWNYQQLRKATEDFGSRMFEIENEKTLTQLWLFRRITYYKGTGSFGVMINPDARQYFFELKTNFTYLQLKSVLNCNSKYAKRLYAIACQYRNMKFSPMPLDEFKKMLGLIDKKGKDTYENATKLKTNVLDIAKKQINENTDVRFDYKLTKVRSRSYNTIHLYINSLPAEQLNLFSADIPKFDKSVEIQKRIKEITSVGVSESLAQVWAVKYWKEYTFEKKELLDNVKNKKILIEKGFDNYLVGIFKKKGYV